MLAILKTFRLGKVLSILLGVLTISIYAFGSIGYLHDRATQLRVSLGLISIFFLTCAGYLMNDYYDIESDTINRPQRIPLKKLISEKNIKGLFISFFLVGLVVALFVNLNFFSIIILDLAILVFYNLYSKRLYLLKNVIVSLVVVSIYPLSFALTAGGLPSLRRDSLFIFPIWLFLIILAYEIVEDIVGMQGDKEEGGNTLPIMIGAKKAKNLAILIALLSTPIAFIPYFKGMCGTVYLIGALLTLPIFIGSMFFKEKTVSIGLLLYVRAITFFSLVDIILIK
jgi:4-hydroxybenzoate polyprenyltransferase